MPSIIDKQISTNEPATSYFDKKWGVDTLLIAPRKEQSYAPKSNYSTEYDLIKNQNIKAHWTRLSIVEIANDHYFIDSKLFKIINCINQSKEILELKNGWADDEGIACNIFTFKRAIEILINYSQSVFDSYGIIIETPEINLAKDGSIDLEWRMNFITLLINIRNSDKIDVHYYSEDIKSETIIKGFLNNTNPNLDLVFWMQKLHKNVIRKN